MSSTITFPLSPTIAWQTASVKLTRKGVSLRSPFTGKRQSVIYPYAVWGFTGKIRTLDNPMDQALMRSFLAQLAGQANNFRLPIPGYVGPLSGYNINTGNTGVVNGANQTGTSLNTNGWPLNTTILKEGDYFTINDELKIVTDDAYSTNAAGGPCNIKFLPALRKAPPNGMQLKIGNQVNLIAPSNLFGATSPWTNSNCTVVDNNAVDPLGTNTAATVTRTAVGSNYLIMNVDPSIFIPGVNYTFSVYLKLGTMVGTFNIYLRDSALGSNNILLPATVTPTGAWGRFSVTGQLPINSVPPYRLQIITNNGALGAGATFFVYGAQLEQSYSMSTYCNTTTGDGNPTILLANNTDDVQWDLSQPVLHDISFEGLEAVE